MSVRGPFSITDRADELAQPWNMWLQPGYSHVEKFHQIAEELYKIPISPLPDPLVPGNRDWTADLAIHEFSYFETWDDVQAVMAEYGTICYSVFDKIELPEEEYPASPREQYGFRIDLELPATGETRLYMIVTIYGTGRVATFAMDATRYQRYSQ